MAKTKTLTIVENDNRRFGYFEIAIFAFMLLEFVILVYYGGLADNNTATAYLLNYEFGFNPQSLVGSVFYLFTDLITGRMIFVVAVISFLFMAAQISLLLGRLVRRSPAEERPSTVTVMLLFLASPLSVTYLLGMHMQRLDVYWIILTLLSLAFIKRPALRWSIPLLCAAAICVHQGFMSTYMPALAIPLLYEVIKSPRRIGNYLLFGASCLIMIALFAYFQWTPPGFPFEKATDLAAYLTQKADFSASAPMLHVGFFAPIDEWLTQYTLPFTASYALPLGLFYLITSLPLLAVFLSVWRGAFRGTPGRLLRWIFPLCAAAPLIFIPAAVLANDWDRYFAAVVNGQFILIFYFLYAREPAVIAAVRKVGDFFDRHPLALPALLIVMNSLTFSTAATDIFSFIADRDAASKLIEDYFNRTVYTVAGSG